MLDIDIQKFKFWSYKILPQTYDDSLSYYQFLMKVLAKLNEVIDIVNQLDDEIFMLIQEALDKYQIPLATETKVGGILCKVMTEDDSQNFTGEIKRDERGFLHFVPYKLPVANSSTLGGVKGVEKGEGYTVPVAVDGEGNMYSKEAEKYVLPMATAEALGGVKADTKTDNETAEVKIDPESGKLYAPAGGGGDGKCVLSDWVNFYDYMNDNKLFSADTALDNIVNDLPAGGTIYFPSGQGKSNMYSFVKAHKYNKSFKIVGNGGNYQQQFGMTTGTAFNVSLPETTELTEGNAWITNTAAAFEMHGVYIQLNQSPETTECTAVVRILYDKGSEMFDTCGVTNSIVFEDVCIEGGDYYNAELAHGLIDIELSTDKVYDETNHRRVLAGVKFDRCFFMSGTKMKNCIELNGEMSVDFDGCNFYSASQGGSGNTDCTVSVTSTSDNQRPVLRFNNCDFRSNPSPSTGYLVENVISIMQNSDLLLTGCRFHNMSQSDLISLRNGCNATIINCSFPARTNAVYQGDFVGAVECSVAMINCYSEKTTVTGGSYQVQIGDTGKLLMFGNENIRVKLPITSSPIVDGGHLEYGGFNKGYISSPPISFGDSAISMSDGYATVINGMANGYFTYTGQTKQTTRAFVNFELSPVNAHQRVFIYDETTMQYAGYGEFSYSQQSAYPGKITLDITLVESESYSDKKLRIIFNYPCCTFAPNVVSS